MVKLTNIEEEIFTILKEKKKDEEIVLDDIIAIFLTIDHYQKEEDFLKYLKEHPEQDFDEVLQVALAYCKE